MTELVDNHIPEPVMKDNPLSWDVPSESEHDVTYHVELGHNLPIGECDCKGFQITCIKQMKTGEAKVARCKHLRRVREKLRKKLFDEKDPLDLVITMLKAQDTNHE